MLRASSARTFTTQCSSFCTTGSAWAPLGDLAPLIEFGASPRATIFLATCSRAHAYLDGRGYVLPEDVKAIGWDVLRHRVLTSFEAEAEEITSDDVVTRVFEAVRVP